MRNNLKGKIIPLPGRRRDGLTKAGTDKPERFGTGELHRGRREDHTQRGFVPAAMEAALEMVPRKPAKRGSASKGAGRNRRRSPSTLLLNNSNVKRKPAGRGRTRL
ncbi:MAG TPA: hypothetical protein VFV23_05635 [Verrucomicrobiae bacterium]|nr:hypothetical protein [Verrucomicrobiae bacterium]